MVRTGLLGMTIIATSDSGYQEAKDFVVNMGRAKGSGKIDDLRCPHMEKPQGLVDKSEKGSHKESQAR